MSQINSHLALARNIAGFFAQLPQVEAITLGGSTASNTGDASSDIDLYVFSRVDIPLNQRAEIVQLSGGAIKSSLGLAYWGSGDEWFHQPTGIEVDVIYFDPQWMVDQLHRVIDLGLASLGYTTCLWHIVNISHSLHDPFGWFKQISQKSLTPYPETLRENIIKLNYPVLRNIIPSYFHQLEKAVRRGDFVSVNHRLAALFASYFDIIYATNRVLHPGEKSLVDRVLQLCKICPDEMENDILAVLRLSSMSEINFLDTLNGMLDRLDIFLEQAGFGNIVKNY